MSRKYTNPAVLLLLLFGGQITAFVHKNNARISGQSSIERTGSSLSFLRDDVMAATIYKHSNHQSYSVSTISATTTTKLTATSSSDEMEDETPSWAFNPLYAAFWFGFIVFAILGPGEFNSPQDLALINDYIANPSDPGFSELFQAIFNYLGLMPIILASIAIPQANNKGLPAVPFFAASFAMGYGAIGKYFEGEISWDNQASLHVQLT